jgi:hypothetical protein
MQGQHENLVKTMLWFLSDSKQTGETAKEGKIWVVAGFHTGRAIVASFFNTAVRLGLEIESIFERDLSANEEDGEITRAWVPVREGEGLENRKRWCVVAVLGRKRQ